MGKTLLPVNAHSKPLHLPPTQMDRVCASHPTHCAANGPKIYGPSEQRLRTIRDTRIVVPNRTIQVRVKTFRQSVHETLCTTKSRSFADLIAVTSALWASEGNVVSDLGGLGEQVHGRR